MKIQWETKNCLLCGGSQTAAFIAACDPDLPEGPRFTVVRCQDCGLCFLNPRPGAASIGQFYRADYAPHQRVGLSPKELAAARRRMRLPAWWRARNPHRYGLPPSGQCRLLDVGCGGGEFLHRMHAQGWQVTGLDLAESVVKRVRDILGLPVLTGTLPHADLKPESFEVVTLWHALEHMPRPLEALRHAYDLLRRAERRPWCRTSPAARPAVRAGVARTAPARTLRKFSPATLRQMVLTGRVHGGAVAVGAQAGMAPLFGALGPPHQQGPRWLTWLASDPLARIVIGICVGRVSRTASWWSGRSALRGKRRGRDTAIGKLG